MIAQNKPNFSNSPIFLKNAFFSQMSFFLMLTRCSLSVRALKGFSLIFGFKNGRFRVKISITKAFSTEI